MAEDLQAVPGGSSGRLAPRPAALMAEDLQAVPGGSSGRLAPRPAALMAEDLQTSISPVPTDEEAAAIVAALAAASPRVAVAADAADEPRWRWAGRWWTRPIPLRRDRPW
jgi:hypothetical protein